MSITPTGSLSLPVHAVRAMLLASPDWQAWCGSLALATAQTYVVAAPAVSPSPHAIVDLAGNLSRTRDGQTIGRFIQRGAVRLYLAASVPSGQDDIDAWTDFANRIDAVMASLETVTGNGGHGAVLNGCDLVAGPMRIPRRERDKYGDLYEVAWDLDVTVWP